MVPWSVAPESLSTHNCNWRLPEGHFQELPACHMLWSIILSKDVCNFLDYASVPGFVILNSIHEWSALIRSHLRSELSSKYICLFSLPIEGARCDHANEPWQNAHLGRRNVSFPIYRYERHFGKRPPEFGQDIFNINKGRPSPPSFRFILEPQKAPE